MKKPLLSDVKGMLSKFRCTSILAAVLVLSACSSTPQLMYPSGTTTRAGVNSMASVKTVEISPSVSKSAMVQTATAQDKSTPKVIPILFTVNDSEHSVLAVLRRWSRAQKVDFSWNANINYSITNRMRGIQSETYNGAVSAMTAALGGVPVPLKVAMGADGLFVTLAQPLASSEPNIAALASMPSPAVVKVAAIPPPAAVPAPPSNLAKVPPPPSIVDLSGWGVPASVVADKSADAAARKAGGVMTGRWLVNDSPTLRSIVEIWAKQTGYRVDWTSTHDYPVNSAVKTGVYTGTFNEALMRLAGAFGQFDTPLGMSFLNSGGMKTVRVFDL